MAGETSSTHEGDVDNKTCADQDRDCLFLIKERFKPNDLWNLSNRHFEKAFSMSMSRIQVVVSGMLLLLILTTTHSAAQWRGDRLEPAPQSLKWNSNTLPLFAPEHKIGGSSLAFAPDATLYSACEKFPDLLLFYADGRSPTTVHLSGDFPKDQQHQLSQVDIEGMSIHDGQIYMVDEDRWVVYVTPLDQPGKVTTLELRGGAFSSNDQRERVKARIAGGSTNYSSLEGIVVSPGRYGPESLFATSNTDPIFYLLDECEKNGDQYVAKIYVGQRVNNEIHIGTNPVSFPLNHGYRLTDLFEYKSALFALKTFDPTFGPHRSYEVVRCDLTNGSLRLECDFTQSALTAAQTKEWDTNYEGVSVHKDRLYLIADNESEPDRKTKTPPTPKDRWRGITPIAILESK